MKKLLVLLLMSMILVTATGCFSSPVDDIRDHEQVEEGLEEEDAMYDSSLYNIGNLMVNANFRVDYREVSGTWSDGFDLMYWVPSVSLGVPDTTVEELKAMKGDTEKLEQEIDNVFEMFAYIQAVDMGNYSGNERKTIGDVSWEISAKPHETIVNNEANCFAMANMIVYMLQGDYEEVGMVWWSVPMDGGHVYNYVKHGGSYYIFDALAYTINDIGDRSYPGYENGQDSGHSGNIRGLVHEIAEDENGDPNFYAWFQLEEDFHHGGLTFLSLIPISGTSEHGVIGTNYSENENEYLVGMDYPLEEAILANEPTSVVVTKTEDAPEW